MLFNLLKMRSNCCDPVVPLLARRNLSFYLLNQRVFYVVASGLEELFTFLHEPVPLTWPFPCSRSWKSLCKRLIPWSALNVNSHEVLLRRFFFSCKVIEINILVYFHGSCGPRTESVFLIFCSFFSFKLRLVAEFVSHCGELVPHGLKFAPLCIASLVESHLAFELFELFGLPFEGVFFLTIDLALKGDHVLFDLFVAVPKLFLLCIGRFKSLLELSHF